MMDWDTFGCSGSRMVAEKGAYPDLPVLKSFPLIKSPAETYLRPPRISRTKNSHRLARMRQERTTSSLVWFSAFGTQLGTYCHCQT
jgi:hypothetical protein